MALKSTIYKAQIQIADMDRNLYADHGLTVACHPSETEERLMMRLLAFALATPADDTHGKLSFAGGISDTDEPDLWQKDLTGALVQWVEVGLPDDRRLTKACGRAQEVKLWAYGHSAPIWWQGIQSKLTRLSNLSIWQIPPEASKALGGMAQRSMQLQFTIQDGALWVGNGQDSIQIEPVLWKGPRA